MEVKKSRQQYLQKLKGSNSSSLRGKEEEKSYVGKRHENKMSLAAKRMKQELHREEIDSDDDDVSSISTVSISPKIPAAPKISAVPRIPALPKPPSLPTVPAKQLIHNGRFNPILFADQFLFDEKSGFPFSEAVREEKLKTAQKTCQQIDINPILELAYAAESESEKNMYKLFATLSIQSNRNSQHRQMSRKQRGMASPIMQEQFVYINEHARVNDRGIKLASGYLFVFSNFFLVKKKQAGDDDDEEEDGENARLLEVNAKPSNIGRKTKRFMTLTQIIAKLVGVAIRKAYAEDDLISMMTIVSNSETKNRVYYAMDEDITTYIADRIMKGCGISEQTHVDLPTVEASIEAKISDSINQQLSVIRASIKSKLTDVEYEEFKVQSIEELEAKAKQLYKGN